MRVLFALPGLHRYNRGAEVALTSIARELVKTGAAVTLIGSGPRQEGTPYRFIRASSIRRENFELFPFFPLFRSETAYEEATFAPGLLLSYVPNEYDVTVTCGYPFTNWVLRRPALRNSRPPHVFVTQNGDWPAHARNSEYGFFGCEGLVCTNPAYHERNWRRWRCALIPNGVDCERFCPGPAARELFGLPSDGFVVLMVSALISSKRVESGIAAVSKIPDAYLVVAGDGPLRDQIDRTAEQLLAGRFSRVSLTSEIMPALYRSADVFLHLSREESFGNVFLEAIASGLPVVAHDSANTRWIVGEHEFLLKSNDPDEIALQLRSARDAPSALRSKRVARAVAFAWPDIARRYREFLETVI